MKTYDAPNIRNVLLVGHGGAGKTTLLEAMLFTSGAITRMGKVEDGNTVSDLEPEEVKKGISVSLAVAPIEWKDVKVNVLDAPGYADFVGDLRSAIRAVDAVLLVVSAVDGVEVQTEVAWEPGLCDCGRRLLALRPVPVARHALRAAWLALGFLLLVLVCAMLASSWS